MTALKLPNDRPNQTFLGRVLKTARTRSIAFSLTLGDLAQVWSDQLGLCRYSGVEIFFDPKGGENQTASLDRIDSSFPYEPDNIRFVHKTVNMMKHTLPSDRFVLLASQVSNPRLFAVTNLIERKSAAQFRGCGVISGEFLGHTRSRARKKGLDYNLSSEYVNSMYVDQRGLCAATGMVMTPKEYSGAVTGNLSIDRLDNNLGYVEGNIRLVTIQANFLRGNLTLEDFLIWCGRITAWNEFIHSDDFTEFYDWRQACLVLN